ncbi:MAG: hypothetical protein ABII88_11710 [Candidatus Omnitrophota bacterium]
MIIKKIFAVINNIEIIAVIVILVMLILTLNENNSAFKGYIEKLENTTSRQISFEKDSASEKISTIEEVTEAKIEAHQRSIKEYLATLREVELNRKRALLIALVNECSNNLDAIRHLDKMQEKELEERWTFPQITFSYEAYQANMNNATIDKFELMDGIVDIYCNLKIIQNFIDNARNPVFTIEARRAYLRQAVRNGAALKEQFEKTVKSIEDFKKKRFEKKEEKDEILEQLIVVD